MSDLTLGLERWHSLNRQALERAGVVVARSANEATPEKRSVWLDFRAGSRLGQVIAWTSGEIELHAGDQDTGVESLHEYLPQASELELASLLVRLLDQLGVESELVGVIQKGSKGDAVRKAQNALKERFYDPGPVDGIFGPKTFKAVKWYQSDRGLTADGIVGPKTWAKLDPPTVKKGSKGSAVTMLQELLDSFGYSPGAIDGEFGSKTENAVKEFQTDFSLVVDGIAGPRTWAKLGS